MDSPPKNGHHGENSIDGHGHRPPKKPKLVAPITSSEIATEFAHHEPSVARINNDSFCSCLSSILSAQSAWQRLFLCQPDQFYFDHLRPEILRSRHTIKDLINADDVEEVFVDGETMKETIRPGFVSLDLCFLAIMKGETSSRVSVSSRQRRRIWDRRGERRSREGF
ncbi:hypothetical protein QJS04_geneDACA002807 [Acorus gramineus]|uniref:Uncharacterized protein n=1 Tax=Acorus gramineus TaxID=55184 RepID=A0AAV9BUK1_ACOGR|nr:hypothetical protein QJS04_geneDACA002807 [Acorus gramineus]